MLSENEARILASLAEGDRVLDVGGWACPFNRADYVMDEGPYETRGFYATIGLPASQGGEREHFTAETWIRRDLCDRAPWPFPDEFFDFSICSQTLEDLRDPLFVCSELVRVSKRGYIEVPSRLAESCRGWEHPALAGLSHHRWLVEIEGSHVEFTFKYHMIHSDPALSFSPDFYATRTDERTRNAWLFWDGRFTFSEQILHGLDRQRAFLRDFVVKNGGDEARKKRSGSRPLAVFGRWWSR